METPVILPDSPRRFTVDEYLMLERAAEARSELIDGRIIAMTGASRAHNLIAGNAAGALRDGLRGGPCEVYQSDMRVRVADTGLFAYPDVVVACPPIEWVDEKQDMLQSPIVLVEVLSPSTAAYDRGEKFLRYQRIAELEHYLLLAQDRCRVEHFRRQAKGWSIQVHESLADVLTLDGIGIEVPLGALYERVLPTG